ncbi:MAG: hypothetical protein M9947_17290 [Thermomicrobiales bacterium]|nr:hypothetical protein [Thermomicrobiales bacterium]
MARPLSQLGYARIQDGNASPRVITLHGHNQHGHTPATLGRTVAPDGRIIGLESYKGVFIGRTVVGYTWYIGPIDRPAPVFFGDALSEIERFLWDELDRQETDSPERPFLVGIEQGAVMAIATALAAPDLISGVIAVDGALPVVPGWDPPLAPLDGLPLLILGDLEATSDAPVLRRVELARQLEIWGGDATWLAPRNDDERDRAMVDWIARQAPRFGAPPASQ